LIGEKHTLLKKWEDTDLAKIVGKQQAIKLKSTEGLVGSD